MIHLLKRFPIVLVLIISGTLSKIEAQSCLAEGINFYIQLEVDSFSVNYPGCKEILGSVNIILIKNHNFPYN